MTRAISTSVQKPTGTHWPLQDAKARFSEVVRRAKEQGPQRVTIHGRDAVVVIDAAFYDKEHAPLSADDIVAALLACPSSDELDLERNSTFAPVRDVSL